MRVSNNYYLFLIKSKIDTSQCKRVCEGVKVSLFSYKLSDDQGVSGCRVWTNTNLITFVFRRFKYLCVGVTYMGKH